jgi:uncharacterized protein (UPF0147 family)
VWLAAYCSTHAYKNSKGITLLALADANSTGHVVACFLQAMRVVILALDTSTMTSSAMHRIQQQLQLLFHTSADPRVPAAIRTGANCARSSMKRSKKSSRRQQQLLLASQAEAAAQGWQQQQQQAAAARVS